jgi:two-component system phosphate regulon response regulator PhoB
MASANDKPVRRLGQFVSLAHGELYLTPTEHRLFEALRARPGETLTRADLLARAMPDALVLERTIDVHVRSLRRKLGAARDCIETVHRAGYRYVAK